MVVYNLSHLTQPSDQKVSGPIQDDEALLFFALVRVMRMRRVLEVGGLGGYSAKNFCEAVGSRGVVYSVDFEPMPKVAENLVVLTKDARDVTPADLDNQPVDLVFWDCHAYEAMLSLHHRLVRGGIITDRTLHAFHDTNLFPQPQSEGSAYEVEGGWRFCPPESQMCNDFKAMGYDVLHFGTRREDHGPDLPYRCGLSFAAKWKPLELKYGPSAPWMTWEKQVAAQYRKIGDFDYEYVG
jgi:hypothetical protein